MSGITFDKYQEAYKQITGNTIEPGDLPPSLVETLFNSKQLNARDFAKLPKDLGVAFLVAHKRPDDEILADTKEKLAHFERKYRMSSEEFHEKYPAFSEALLSVGADKLCDFLSWESCYETYLELTNGDRR